MYILDAETSKDLQNQLIVGFDFCGFADSMKNVEYHKPAIGCITSIVAESPVEVFTGTD